MNADILRTIRVSKNLTQQEFAKSLRVATSTIAMIESNQRKISDKLRTRIKQTYGGDETVAEAIRREKEFDKMALI